MEPRTIVESRLKTLLGLAFFVALTVFAADPTPGGGRAWTPWLGAIGGLGSFGQAPGSLPGGWPVAAPELAQLLNDYCWEANHAHHHQGAAL